MADDVTVMNADKPQPGIYTHARGDKPFGGKNYDINGDRITDADRERITNGLNTDGYTFVDKDVEVSVKGDATIASQRGPLVFGDCIPGTHTHIIHDRKRPWAIPYMAVHVDQGPDELRKANPMNMDNEGTGVHIEFGSLPPVCGDVPQGFTRPAFAVGDVVRLKSGGPLMTVSSEFDGSFFAAWFDDEKHHHSTQFAPQQLVKADPNAVNLTVAERLAVASYGSPMPAHPSKPTADQFSEPMPTHDFRVGDTVRLAASNAEAGWAGAAGQKMTVQSVAGDSIHCSWDEFVRPEPGGKNFAGMRINTETHDAKTLVLVSRGVQTTVVPRGAVPCSSKPTVSELDAILNSRGPNVEVMADGTCRPVFRVGDIVNDTNCAQPNLDMRIEKIDGLLGDVAMCSWEGCATGVVPLKGLRRAPQCSADHHEWAFRMATCRCGTKTRMPMW